MTTDMKANLEIICSELGKQAFIEGKTSVPAHDINLVNILKDINDFNFAIVLLGAWSSGWHTANIQGIKKGV